MAHAQAVASNRADAVGEIITEANVTALNAALADSGIDAQRILAILPVAAQTMASPASAKYRVLYRLS